MENDKLAPCAAPQAREILAEAVRYHLLEVQPRSYLSRRQRDEVDMLLCTDMDTLSDERLQEILQRDYAFEEPAVGGAVVSPVDPAESGESGGGEDEDEDKDQGESEDEGTEAGAGLLLSGASEPEERVHDAIAEDADDLAATNEMLEAKRLLASVSQEVCTEERPGPDTAAWSAGSAPSPAPNVAVESTLALSDIQHGPVPLPADADADADVPSALSADDALRELLSLSLCSCLSPAQQEAARALFQRLSAECAGDAQGSGQLLADAGLLVAGAQRELAQRQELLATIDRRLTRIWFGHADPGMRYEALGLLKRVEEQRCTLTYAALRGLYEGEALRLLAADDTARASAARPGGGAQL